ncbi:MAG: large exoprotein, partial [Gemmatimonadaceae bacterium]|nr:large exoprotein [Gemmatimonadaceae bacterium]
MGGQVLGGGVIVLVAAALWLVYLLPTWHSRRQYDAAERNAVRLNQALRVLAETSETPEEVRLELNARTAAAQQKLAKRALAEREQAALEGAKADLELARTARVAAEAA